MQHHHHPAPKKKNDCTYMWREEKKKEQNSMKFEARDWKIACLKELPVGMRENEMLLLGMSQVVEGGMNSQKVRFFVGEMHVSSLV